MKICQSPGVERDLRSHFSEKRARDVALHLYN